MTRPQRYHHGDLRAELLRRAEATLREKGTSGLSLRQLAREAGVSHAAPSRHFPDREALLDALAVVGFERLAARYGPDSIEGTFTERLQATARAYFDFAIENPALLTLMFTRKHSSPQASGLAAAAGRAFAFPVAQIASGQAAGEVIPGDPAQISLSVAAAVQGVAEFAIAGLVPAGTAENLLHQTVTFIAQGLRPPA